MKREVDYHEVTVRFVVAKREARRAVLGFQAARSQGGGSVKQLGVIVAAGIGGNEMNCLDVEDLEIEIDGTKC